MTSEKHMLAAAAEVTGDDIAIAGLFSPRGASGKRTLGLMAGNVIGGIVGSELGGATGDFVGSIVGGSAGMVAGEAAAADHVEGAQAGGVINFVVAVGEEKVYILRPDSAMAITRENLAVAYTFDLDTLAVTLHSRVAVRTMTLEDTETGESLELEGARIGWSHAKATTRFLLDHAQAHHEKIEAAQT